MLVEEAADSALIQIRDFASISAHPAREVCKAQHVRVDGFCFVASKYQVVGVCIYVGRKIAVAKPSL
jgi:hypothetical protein